MRSLKALALVTSVSILTACGGGSGGGEDPQSRTLEAGDKTYAEELAISAGEGSKSLVSSGSGGFAPVAFVGESNTVIDTLKEKLQQSVEIGSHSSALSLLPVGAQETTTDREDGNCGGYYETTETTTTPDSPPYFPFNRKASTIYADYCDEDEGYQTIINGSITWEYTLTDPENTSWKWYYDVSASSTTPYGPQSWTWKFNETCNTVNGVETCSSSSAPYVASSGTSYTFENASVSGNNSSGYNIEGELTDNQGNSFDVSVEGLTQCDSGNISSGTITITSSTGEIVSVTFPNCNECVIGYAGDSWVIPQP